MIELPIDALNVIFKFIGTKHGLDILRRVCKSFNGIIGKSHVTGWLGSMPSHMRFLRYEYKNLHTIICEYKGAYFRKRQEELLFPLTVKVLIIPHNEIVKIKLHEGLIKADLSNNLIVDLVCPRSLVFLNARGNRLKTCALNGRCEAVNIASNRLTKLHIPLSMKLLKCGNNRFEELRVPENVLALDCSHNAHLKHLDFYNSHLIHLDIEWTGIRSLPQLPITLEYLNMHYCRKITGNLILPPFIIYADLTDSAINSVEKPNGGERTLQQIIDVNNYQYTAHFWLYTNDPWKDDFLIYKRGLC